LDLIQIICPAPEYISNLLLVLVTNVLENDLKKLKK